MVQKSNNNTDHQRFGGKANKTWSNSGTCTLDVCPALPLIITAHSSLRVYFVDLRCPIISSSEQPHLPVSTHNTVPTNEEKLIRFLC